MVSQNNDGNYYEIAVDTAKEGAEVWSLNDWFKARVGDEGTPLVMRFYTQGQLNSFDGHQKPIIQGNVGAYSFDENGQIVMAADAKVVSWTGDPSDMLPGGRVCYHFPQQMFPVEGAFYGFVGYVDESNGRRLTGVNVWFRVLGGVAQMGKACDYYISELDKAIKEAEEKLKAGQKDQQQIIDEYQQKVTDLVNQLNTQGQTANSMMERVKAGLTTLETKIQQDGLFTQAEAEAFEQTIRDHLQKMVDEANAAMNNTVVSNYSAMAASDQENFYAEAMPTYYRDSFDHATNDVPHGDHIVNIAYITDNHHQEDANPWSPKSYSGKSLEHYQWFAQATLRTKPEVAIANGDNINGDSYRPSDIWTTMHVWSMLSTVYLKTALFMLPGNHDTGIGQTPKLVPAAAMDEDDLKNIYHTRQPLYGEVRNGDSLYFYKDLPDKKVRVIGLNSSDMPWTTDQQGNYVHNRLEEAAFSAVQLQWLVTKALVLPDNTWQVVFFFHHPLSTGGFVNAQAFIDIIKAFKAGASTSINRNDADDMPIVGLTADFKAQGPGTVIGVFNGHLHADSQDMTTLGGTPIVITDASLSNFIDPQLARRETVKEDCWETISINTDSRTIHCYRFGRGADREFSY